MVLRSFKLSNLLVLNFDWRVLKITYACHAFSYHCMHNFFLHICYLTAKGLGIGNCEVQSFPLSACIDFRVIAKGNCLICPSAQGDANVTNYAYIEVLSFAGTDSYRELFKEIGEEWLKLGGLPHWAKQWTHIDGIFDKIQEGYGENLEKFKKVFDHLGSTDPAHKDIFVNSTLQKILS